MSLNLNSLAELTSIKIDRLAIETEWESFLSHNRNNIDWDFRVLLELDSFSDYFKTLLNSVCDIVQEAPKYYMLQVFDRNLFTQKQQLNIVHKDVDRNSCITIPIIYNVMEPVMFYEDIPGLVQEEYRKTNMPWPEKPTKIGRYSENHPTLVNVQKLHNVRVLDNTSPRILLQLSFDASFDDMIEKNPAIWRII